MMLPGPIMLLLAILPGAAATPTQPDDPEPPAILARYLTDGVVPPGDYRWMRGRFPGAGRQETGTFLAMLRHEKSCAAQSRAAMRAKFAALGQAFDPGDGLYARPAACRQFQQPAIPADTGWDTFSAALEKVRPYALGILRATELAERQLLDRGDFPYQLRLRTVGEQTLRYAWIESQQHGGATRDYTPLERVIHEGILLRALEDRDQANTRWLARQVAANGWPSRSRVGDDASGSAWLLVQHADADPAFQWTALRLMTPLAETGEIDPRNFAMLTDRVQLGLSGKQRYGTQWTCDAGKRVPLPLTDDAAATDRLRATVKLDTLNDNAARITAMYGPCPPES